ncbi:alpha/beta fold hydrolase [Variovorax ureilyticus]|uniref:Alpha/beta fold hydrolase n=1 Tax=Variovorax ureilyticus TaxID=1836198 RepID=A0ABU8VL14_9BURK
MNPESLQRLFDNWARTWLSQFRSDETAASPLSDDPRFKDPSWTATPYGQFLLKWYEAAARTAKEIGNFGTALPPHQKSVWNFYVQYAIDALSPSNYFLTNPQAIQRAADTRGESILIGVTRMLQDLQRNALPATSDMETFKVGKNLAPTSGSVVYQNEIFQLIQYEPLATRVNAVPLLIVPPCVNKFYAFDLNEQKSFVRFLLEQGHNVFIMSWRNPRAGETHHSWADYVFDGVHKAVELTCEVGDSAKVNLMSWCIGGALAASAIGVMNPNEKKRVASATFLTTLVDYSDHGEVGIFIDEPQVCAFEPRVRMKGVMPGQDLAKAMAMLHANDSIWNFYVNNYLLGDNIPPFDVLYWNSDTANIPADLYQYYVENMYLKNLMRVPGALSLRGRKMDVSKIDVPCLFVSASEDHIVPWRTTLLALELVSGPSEFLLTEGGHVSGTVINHPAKSRKSYWVNGPRTMGPDAWKEGAERRQGSWWPEWCSWVSRIDDRQIAAPKELGTDTWPALEPAPGSYVVEQVPQG